ncbi:MAG TPA: hypothetical protein VKV40_15750 [Ktedonobacteraceae bacterium]|nr:hypothetical protein [Ktedonobacteraceae bacterium]
MKYISQQITLLRWTTEELWDLLQHRYHNGRAIHLLQNQVQVR